MNQYTIHDIQLQIQNNIEVLISPWMTNRVEGYTLDSATKNLLALGFWLDAELHKLGCSDIDRRTQIAKYNRLSRTYDIWEIALECLNDVVCGKVEQGRKAHRRWG